jgi:hypothetical protein
VKQYRQIDERSRSKNTPPPPVHPPSLSALQEILKRVVRMGTISWTNRFKMRCKLRGGGSGFNTVDVQRTIKSGTVVLGPRFDPEFNSFRYQLAATVDGYQFIVEILLDCTEDYQLSPRVTVKTAFFRRGRRRGVKDTNNEDGMQKDAD